MKGLVGSICRTTAWKLCQINVACFCSILCIHCFNSVVIPNSTQGQIDNISTSQWLPIDPCCLIIWFHSMPLSSQVDGVLPKWLTRNSLDISHSPTTCEMPWGGAHNKLYNHHKILQLWKGVLYPAADYDIIDTTASYQTQEVVIVFAVWNRVSSVGCGIITQSFKQSRGADGSIWWRSRARLQLVEMNKWNTPSHAI